MDRLAYTLERNYGAIITLHLNTPQLNTTTGRMTNGDKQINVRAVITPFSVRTVKPFGNYDAAFLDVGQNNVTYTYALIYKRRIPAVALAQLQQNQAVTVRGARYTIKEIYGLIDRDAIELQLAANKAVKAGQ